MQRWKRTNAVVVKSPMQVANGWGKKENPFSAKGGGFNIRRIQPG